MPKVLREKKKIIAKTRKTFNFTSLDISFALSFNDCRNEISAKLKTGLSLIVAK